MVTISYAIPVCNEVEYIGKLLDSLEPFLQERKEDEIVILQDTTKQSDKLNQILEEYQNKFIQEDLQFKVFCDKFQGDFAAWKNKLNGFCTRDYIFQIDADETPCFALCKALPKILELNSEVGLFRVPRENFVEGLTQDDIIRWGWRIEPDENCRVNWPDYQDRIYKNKPNQIEWEGRVHEKIIGYDKYANLPMKKDFSLYHNKTIDRQRSQNSYYQSLVR